MNIKVLPTQDLQIIESLAIYRGAQVGISFAEGFVLLRSHN